MRTFIVMPLLLIEFFASYPARANDSNACLPVVSALNDHDELDGKFASVCGFLKYQFEDTNLYASKKAADAHSVDQCMSIREAPNIPVYLGKYNNKFVRLSGTFTSHFCPENSVCPSSCSEKYGIAVKAVAPERK